MQEGFESSGPTFWDSVSRLLGCWLGPDLEPQTYFCAGDPVFSFYFYKYIFLNFLLRYNLRIMKRTEALDLSVSASCVSKLLLDTHLDCSVFLIIWLFYSMKCPSSPLVAFHVLSLLCLILIYPLQLSFNYYFHGASFKKIFLAFNNLCFYT